MHAQVDLKPPVMLDISISGGFGQGGVHKFLPRQKKKRRRPERATGKVVPPKNIKLSNGVGEVGKSWKAQDKGESLL